MSSRKRVIRDDDDEDSSPRASERLKRQKINDDDESVRSDASDRPNRRNITEDSDEEVIEIEDSDVEDLVSERDIEPTDEELARMMAIAPEPILDLSAIFEKKVRGPIQIVLDTAYKLNVYMTAHYPRCVPIRADRVYFGQPLRTRGIIYIRNGIDHYLPADMTAAEKVHDNYPSLCFSNNDLMHIYASSRPTRGAWIAANEAANICYIEDLPADTKAIYAIVNDRKYLWCEGKWVYIAKY